MLTLVGSDDFVCLKETVLKIEEEWTDRSYIDTKQTIRNPVHNMNIICCYFYYYGKHFLNTIDVCKTAIFLGIAGLYIVN